MTGEKPIPKLLLRPVTRGANSTINRSQFLKKLPVTCSKRKEGTICFGLASDWLRTTDARYIKPITNRSIRNLVMDFDSHLKTDLSVGKNFRTNFLRCAESDGGNEAALKTAQMQQTRSGCQPK